MLQKNNMQHNADFNPFKSITLTSRIIIYTASDTSAFSALTLLVGHQEEHLACKKCDEVLAQFSVWSKMWIIMVALYNRADHYIFALLFLSSIYLLSSFFSSPNLSGCRLDVYHTSTHGVALV